MLESRVRCSLAREEFPTNENGRDMTLTDEQVKIYLSRLGCEDPGSPSLETLNKLTFQHLICIPFSTVDLCRTKIAPDLTLEGAFTKVIDRRRGGYCFELNFVFQKLLVALGFDAKPAIARVGMGMAERRAFSHRCSVVYLDGKSYVVDVGFGGPAAAGAVLLEEGVEQEIFGDTFYTRQLFDATWALYRITKKVEEVTPGEEDRMGWKVIEFYLIPVVDDDFLSLNVRLASPGMLFYEQEILNIRTPEGNTSYKPSELTIRKHGEVQIIPIAEGEEFDKMCEEHFFFTP